MYFPKDDFVGIRDVAHLAAGGETPQLKSHLAAMAQFATDKSMGMPGRERFFAVRQRVAAKLAQLMNVPASDVAFVGSSSAAMTQIVSAIDWRPGDEVVVVDDEYPSGRYLFRWLERYGVVTRQPAYHQDPDVEVANIESALSERTCLVYVSHVSTRTGRKIDIGRITEAAHRVGARILVDATHSLGITPVDAAEIDFLVCSGYKWLLGSHMGIVMWNRRRVAEFHPQVGWRSALPGSTPREYVLHEDAARLEVGNPNFVDLYILDNALNYHMRVDIATLAAYAETQGTRLIEFIDAPASRLLTPIQPNQRAGNICYATDHAKAIVTEAATHGVVLWGDHDLRRIRLSIHGYVTPKDVEHAGEIVSTLLLTYT